mmetsp:Transcript_11253/g.48031  ORF Transcript_11253/g.48031 Transcript_11253/m.48031 type:complete len:245 (-) Transcript_11253:28-762(-)
MRPVASPAATEPSLTSNASAVTCLVWCKRSARFSRLVPTSRCASGHTVTVFLSKVPRNVPFGDATSGGGTSVFASLSTDLPLPSENAWTRPPSAPSSSDRRCQHDRKITSRACWLRPPGTAMLSTGPGATSTAPAEPSCAFQDRIVPSREAVRSTCPPGCAGWNATDVTSAVWPTRGAPSGAPVAVEKHRTASPEHAYRRLPSGDTAFGLSVRDPPALCPRTASATSAGRSFGIAAGNAPVSST